MKIKKKRKSVQSEQIGGIVGRNVQKRGKRKGEATRLWWCIVVYGDDGIIDGWMEEESRR